MALPGNEITFDLIFWDSINRQFLHHRHAKLFFPIPESLPLKQQQKLKLFHTEDDAAGGLVILEQRERESERVGALKIALHV